MAVGRTELIILVQGFTVWWWITLIYSRRQAEMARRAAEARYAAWDNAYKGAVKADKTEQEAVKAAASAAKAGPDIVKLWEDTLQQSPRRRHQEIQGGHDGHRRRAESRA